MVTSYFTSIQSSTNWTPFYATTFRETLQNRILHILCSFIAIFIIFRKYISQIFCRFGYFLFRILLILISNPSSLAEWSDAWSIDPITGVLSPTRPLLSRRPHSDREVIRVRARNRWNPSTSSGSVTSVSISIRPVNRYAPQIRINRPPVVEIRPYGVIYAVVSIRDADEGENGLVDLTIKEGDPNGSFRITPTSSRNEFYVEMSPIVANNLSPGERLHIFNLTLKATDRGTPTKSSEKVRVPISRKL